MSISYHEVVREQSGIPLPQQELELKLTERKQEDEAIKRTIKVQWLEDYMTKQMVSSMQKNITQLETRARELACNYSLNQNHLEIINLLVRAEELRNTIKTYVS